MKRLAELIKDILDLIAEIVLTHVPAEVDQTIEAVRAVVEAAA